MLERLTLAPIIQVENLVRKYGDFTAVDEVSFSVEPGEVFGFLGPNGAGKTTTINVLCTLLRPTAGRAWVAGYDVARDPMKVRQSIGIIFQDPSLDERLNAMENLRFHARIYFIPREEREARMGELLEMVELSERRAHLVKFFSGGMKRRLEIARGLLHHPRVLFLDEPTLGLDPQTRVRIWEYLRRLREERQVTLFLTTHYMEEAENCDRIAIIDHGKIVALDTPEGLKREIGGDVIIVRAGNPEASGKEIESRYGLKVHQTDGVLSFEVPHGEEFVPQFLRTFPFEVKAVSVRRPTLEDVFIKLTGRVIREEEIGELDQMRGHVRAWRRSNRR